MNIGYLEVVVILLAAFVFIGPKDLPKIARWLARQVKKFKRSVVQLRKEIGWDEIEKEVRSEMEDMRQDVEQIKQGLKESVTDAQKELEEVGREVKDAAEEVPKELQAVQNEFVRIVEEQDVRGELAEASCAVKQSLADIPGEVKKVGDVANEAVGEAAATVVKKPTSMKLLNDLTFKSFKS